MSTRITNYITTHKLKNEITFKLQKVLKSNSPDKCARALEILSDITDRRCVDKKLTTIADKIFLTENKSVYSEKYKDILEKLKLNSSYFEIPRLLQNEQYEQAALLAIEDFEKLSENPYLLKDKTALNLKLFTILEQATARNDTTILLDLLKKLNTDGILTSFNLSKILAGAIKHENDQVMLSLYDFVKENDFTDDTLSKYIATMIRVKEIEKSLVILSKIQSLELKRAVCWKIVRALEFEDSIALLDSLTQQNILEVPRSEGLSAMVFSIGDLDNYENISNYLETLPTIHSTQLKQYVIHSLLLSIDNNNVFISSTIFLLNGLGIQRTLLTEKHKDVIFHQLSKYALKLLGLKLYKYFKSKEFTISLKNYFHLIKNQSHGGEYDTIFYFVVEALAEHKSLSIEITDFLKSIEKSTSDSRITLVLNECTDIGELKSKINYEFIEKNLENELERSRDKNFALEGLSASYDFANDARLTQSLKI